MDTAFNTDAMVELVRQVMKCPIIVLTLNISESAGGYHSSSVGCDPMDVVRSVDDSII